MHVLAGCCSVHAWCGREFSAASDATEKTFVCKFNGVGACTFECKVNMSPIALLRCIDTLNGRGQVRNNSISTVDTRSNYDSTPHFPFPLLFGKCRLVSRTILVKSDCDFLHGTACVSWRWKRRAAPGGNWYTCEIGLSTVGGSTVVFISTKLPHWAIGPFA